MSHHESLRRDKSSSMRIFMIAAPFAICGEENSCCWIPRLAGGPKLRCGELYGMFSRDASRATLGQPRYHSAA